MCAPLYIIICLFSCFLHRHFVFCNSHLVASVALRQVSTIRRDLCPLLSDPCVTEKVKNRPPLADNTTKNIADVVELRPFASCVIGTSYEASSQATGVQGSFGVHQHSVRSSLVSDRPSTENLCAQHSCRKRQRSVSRAAKTESRGKRTALCSAVVLPGMRISSQRFLKTMNVLAWRRGDELLCMNFDACTPETEWGSPESKKNETMQQIACRETKIPNNKCERMPMPGSAQQLLGTD